MVSRLGRWIDHWIFDRFETSPESLGIARIILAALALSYLYDADNPRYLWYANFPSTIYAPPPGLAWLFPGLPGPLAMHLLMGTIIALLTCVLVGWHTKIASRAAAMAMILANTFEYSFGKINHDILPIAALLVLSFSTWGEAYSVDASRVPKRESPPRWPLALLALLAGLAMLSAALPKITSGWLSLATQSARGHLLGNRLETERVTAIGSAMLKTLPTAAWELLDWATILLEGSFIFAVFSPRNFRLVCAVGVLFHSGTHWSMDIFFPTNLAVYAVFFDWQSLVGNTAVARAIEKIVSLTRWWVPLLAGVGGTLLLQYVGNPIVKILDVFGDGRWIRDSILAVLSSGLAIAVLAKAVAHWRWSERNAGLR